MTTKHLSAGVRDCWLSFLDTDNIAIGNNITDIAAGDIRGSYPFVGIQNMPTGIPEGDTITVPGDDGILGSFNFGSDAPREFVMNFGQGDLELDALLQSTLVEALGDIRIGLGDPVLPTLRTVCLIVNSRAIKRDSGSSGQQAWGGWIFPVVQIQPLNREQLAGRTAGAFRYKAVAQAAYNHPWGITLAQAVNGNPGSFSFPFTSPHPLTLDAFRGNGVKTNWTLNKTPYNTTNTLAFAERVQQTVTGVTPSSKLAVISPAVANNARGDVLYAYTS